MANKKKPNKNSKKDYSRTEWHDGEYRIFDSNGKLITTLKSETKDGRD